MAQGLVPLNTDPVELDPYIIHVSNRMFPDKEPVVRLLFLLPATIILSSGCQPSGPTASHLVRNPKSKACVKASASLDNSPAASDSFPRWEGQFKTYSDLEILVGNVSDLFTFGLLTTSEQKLRPGYLELWNTIQLRSDRIDDLDAHLARLLQGMSRYRDAGSPTKTPWWWVGIIHGLESGYNFSRHLHNGDPLKARTFHVPSGRPKTGVPPFAWETSAADAISTEEILKTPNWPNPGYIAYSFENYNGFGYRSKGINSPYLWAFSQHYSKGKYIADGKFSSGTASDQAGAMAILKRAIDKGVVNINQFTTEPSAEVQNEYQNKLKTLPPLSPPSDDCAQ